MKGVSIYRADRLALGKVIRTWDMSSLGVLTGNAEIYRLAHSWIANLIGIGYRVHVIDCAIRFNRWGCAVVFGYGECAASVYAIPDTRCLPRNIESAEVCFGHLFCISSVEAIF